MAPVDSTLQRAPAAPSLPLWAWPLLALLLGAVYVVGYDQGAMLQPLLGAASRTYNYVHEFVHDGRHLLGFPCH